MSVLWMTHQCIALKVKAMDHNISAGHTDYVFNNLGVVQHKFVPAGQTVDSTSYIKVLRI